MINRILDFSEAPARFRVRVAQLSSNAEDLPEVSVPLADLAVVLVAHPQVTYTQAVLSGLAGGGRGLLACDGNLPVGMLLPLAAHTTQAERFAAQARAPCPCATPCDRSSGRRSTPRPRSGRAPRHGFRREGVGRPGAFGRPEQRRGPRRTPLLAAVFADLDFRRHARTKIKTSC